MAETGCARGSSRHQWCWGETSLDARLTHAEETGPKDRKDPGLPSYHWASLSDVLQVIKKFLLGVLFLLTAKGLNSNGNKNFYRWVWVSWFSSSTQFSVWSLNAAVISSSKTKVTPTLYTTNETNGKSSASSCGSDGILPTEMVFYLHRDSLEKTGLWAYCSGRKIAFFPIFLLIFVNKLETMSTWGGMRKDR